jgi:plastocyanin
MNKVLMLAIASLNLSSPAVAAEVKSYDIIIKDHKFTPDAVEVPAGEKIKLLVKNQDDTPEEFESHDLKREKVIKGGKEATIIVGPLAAGEYKFFGEFNEKTAQGKFVAK